ncbi:hypothetical protein ACFL6B_00015 [Thermodesulfobacteriota bacterium]
MQLNHAILLSEGKSLYSISKEPPLVIESYGPANPFLIAPLLKIFGKTLFAPRLLSFIFFLMEVLLIAYAVFSLTRSWKFLFLSIGLNIFMLRNFQWLLLCRSDSLGNILLFLTIFIHWKFPYNNKAIIFSLLIGILAFFTKIYFVCGFGGIVLSYWFIHRDKKMALAYLICSSGLLIAAFLIANHITNGLYYLFTFELRSQYTKLSFSYLLQNLKSLLSYYFPLFALIVYALIKGSFNYHRYGVLFVHLLIGFPLFAFLLLNTGSSFYYWYSILPSLIIIGCDLIYLEIRNSNCKLLMPVLLFIVLIMVNRVVYRDFIRGKLVTPSPELSRKWEPLEKMVKNAKGRVMNDDVTAILNIRAGKELYSEGQSYLKLKGQLRNKYNYSFTDLTKDIGQQKFALIINPKEKEPEEKEVIEKYYKLLNTYYFPMNIEQYKYKVEVFVPKFKDKEMSI